MPLLRRRTGRAVARQSVAGVAAASWPNIRSCAFQADSATATTWRPAASWAIRLRHHLADCLQEFKAAGKLILGICNGFQILLKSGVLLPLAEDFTGPATLAWNASGKFEDRWVPLVVSSQQERVLCRHRNDVPADCPRRRQVRSARRASAARRWKPAGRSCSATARPAATSAADGAHGRLSRQSQRFAGRHRRHLRRDRAACAV